MFAVLVGSQRIASQAHYPSDVFLGAAAGCSVATLLLYVGWRDGMAQPLREALAARSCLGKRQHAIVGATGAAYGNPSSSFTRRLDAIQPVSPHTLIGLVAEIEIFAGG